MVFMYDLYTRFVYFYTYLSTDRERERVVLLMFLQGYRRILMKKRINITLEDEVVRRVDSYADEHYTSRSGAITMLIVEATDKPVSKKGASRGDKR